VEGGALSSLTSSLDINLSFFSLKLSRCPLAMLSYVYPLLFSMECDQKLRQRRAAIGVGQKWFALEAFPQNLALQSESP